MKKLSFSLLLMLGLFSTAIISCNDDDDEPPLIDPIITDIDPEEGPVGTPVTITGANFGSNPVVRFGTVTATTSDVSTTSITTSVPTGASGSLQVTVENDGETSDGITFNVTDGNGSEQPMGPATAADSISNIEDLNNLSAAITAAGIGDALDDADQVTIFAPSNAAFDSLVKYQGAENLEALVAALTAEGVGGILQAHVIADSLPADLLMEQEYATLNEGSSITITTDADGNVFANGAQVTTPNITVGNGVIHVIDSVINIDAPSIDAGATGTVRVASSEDGVGTTTWTANNTYILDGFVYVNEGQTLTIEAGTVIKGRPGQAARASALIVARGGVIEANGTAEAPIIFTAEADDLNGSVADDASGLWGGVIILGNASTNNLDANGVKNIEGIPTEEPRGAYGGSADDDNSGTLSYVSIRHGGSIIGANNEINGLTLGGVGSGTTIDHVEVWSNLDDGIEFFGGTVNASNLVVAYPGDDGLDADEGYRGNIQNAIVWQTSGTLNSGDPRAMELDGGVGANEAAEPYSTPIFANLTLFYDEGDNDLENAFILRDNSGASVYNSIAINHDATIALERLADSESSYNRYEDGAAVFSGNIFYNVNGVTDAANFADLFVIDADGDATIEGEVETALAASNMVSNPTFGTGAAKFTPTGDVTTGIATLPEEAGLSVSTYIGAVDPAAASPYFANWSKTWAVINQ